MPKDVVEQGTFERAVLALERLAGDREVLTGIEELSATMAGGDMSAPVGPAIEKLAESMSEVADAGNEIAKAINRIAEQMFMNGPPVAMVLPASEDDDSIPGPGPDPACVGPADPYEGLTRADLRKLCDKRKIHTNSKMSIPKLRGLLELAS